MSPNTPDTRRTPLSSAFSADRAVLRLCSNGHTLAASMYRAESREELAEALRLCVDGFQVDDELVMDTREGDPRWMVGGCDCARGPIQSEPTEGRP